MDGEGFPKRSDVFAGNVSEPKTLAGMISTLSSPGMMHPLIVMDAGIATAENIRWLKERGYAYLVVSRQKKGAVPAAMVTVVSPSKVIFRINPRSAASLSLAVT